MRVGLLVLLVASGLSACGDGGDAATDAVDTVVVETEVEPCSTWADFACPPSAQTCVAQCLEKLKISCNGRQCLLQGEGMGAGKSCTISADDRQDGCGLCETAWKECR